MTVMDWVVLVGYALVLLISGIIVAQRKTETTEDYFLGSRSMPWWAVAISLLATSLSAATFIGGPHQAYASDLTYLSATIGGVLGAIIIAIVFIPRFYRHGVTTVYELLEHRYGSAARYWSSAMFMLGRLLASGARIFMAALPIAMIVFGADAELGTTQFGVAIGGLVLVGVAYTLVGGVASVIWTDVIQFVVFVGCAVAAALIIWGRLDASATEVIELLQTSGQDGSSKLTVLDVGMTRESWNSTYTLLTAITGWTLFNVAAYGTDQDLAQRLLTCDSPAKGSRSIISGILLGIPVTLVFMCLGLLLFVFYRENPPAPEVGPRVFLHYILVEMPAGLRGLMLAGLFAAGLSSLNSALNALSSTLVTDIYRPLSPDRSESHYLFVSRVAVAGWGVVLGCFALGCAMMFNPDKTTLLDFALGVMMYAYAGLAAVFLVGLLTDRGNTISVLLALLTGAGMIALMRYGGAMVDMETSSWAWLFSLRMPWQMMLATTAAIAVCASVRSPAPK